MRGHDWKSITPSVSQNGYDVFKLGPYDKPISSEWIPDHPENKFDYRPDTKKVWRCTRCGTVIAAQGDEKMSDARRKCRVPSDCDMALVAQVHKL